MLKKMNIKRAISVLLALVMAVSLSGMVAFAEPNSNEHVTIDKQVVKRVGPDEWEIELRIKPKQDISSKPIQVALVLDISYSMNNKPLEDVKAAAIGLLEVFEGIGSVYASVSSFGTKGTIVHSMQKVDAASLEGSFTDAIEDLDTDNTQYTNLEDGIFVGMSSFRSTIDADRYLIILSDGVPTAMNISDPRATQGDSQYITNPDGPNYSTNNPHPEFTEKALDRAKLIPGKNEDTGDNGVTVFTVGYNLAPSSDAETTLRAIAGMGNREGGYYAGSSGDIGDVFTNLAKVILSMVIDPMTDEFKVIGTSTAVIVDGDGELTTNAPTVVSDTLYWSPGMEGVLEKDQELVIRYTVKLKEIPDPEKYDKPTNKDAILQYSVNDKSYELDFPVPEVHYETGRIEVWERYERFEAGEPTGTFEDDVLKQKSDNFITDYEAAQGPQPNVALLDRATLAGTVGGIYAPFEFLNTGWRSDPNPNVDFAADDGFVNGLPVTGLIGNGEQFYATVPQGITQLLYTYTASRTVVPPTPRPTPTDSPTYDEPPTPGPGTSEDLTTIPEDDTPLGAPQTGDSTYLTSFIVIEAVAIVGICASISAAAWWRKKQRAN